MMDEQGQTAAVQPEAVAGQEAPASEPVDIAQAFQMLREADKAPAEPAVPEEGAGSGEGFEPVAGAAPEPAVPDQLGMQGESAGNAGGSPAPEPGIDIDSIGKGIIDRIRDEARKEIAKEFSDNNVRIMSIKDLHEVREDGTVVFNNPDDPRHPFTSRAEAQRWIESINTQIQEEYQSRILKRAGEKWNEAQPQIQMLRFAPYYRQMDQVSREIFDQMIEPYAIVDKSGKTVGFNCNLASVATNAMKIAKRFEQRKPEPAKADPPVSEVKTPAMDMKTGSGSSTDDGEPKTLEEAMRRLNASKKEKKNG